MAQDRKTQQKITLEIEEENKLKPENDQKVFFRLLW